jgi:hypothetical protein
MKKILFIIISATIFGLLMSILIHSGYYHKLIMGFKSVHFLLYLPLIILFLVLNILIHELGHMFSFIFQGVKIKALFFIIFGFIVNDKKVKFKVYPKNFKMLGGFVVPNFAPIENDEEYHLTRKKFTNALIAGPNTSIIYFIIVMIVFFLSWFLFKSSILLGLMSLLFITSFFMTLLIIFSSKLNTDEIYGDYVAFDKMKKDDRFALVQILQYRQFSDINSMLENDFFLELIKKDLEEKRLSNKMFDIVLSTYYLTMYLKTVKIEETNKIIDYYNVSFLASSKYGRELAYLISAFYYKNGNSEEAVKLFNLVNSVKNHNLDSEALELLKKQYEHLLNLADNHEYFISNSNSLLNQYSFLAPVINIGKVIEELTYKLPFVPYSCKVLFNLEEQTENNID